jgi:Zn-dependent M28 family amino/carboxypeptidase
VQVPRPAPWPAAGAGRIMSCVPAPDQEEVSLRFPTVLSVLVLAGACGTGAPAGPPAPGPVPAPPPAAAAPLAPLPQGVVPSRENPRIHEIVRAVSAARLESDVRTLVGFHTRHTLSDTLSATRGIGAARRWLFQEFERISRGCGGCLEVRYVSEIIPGDPASRIRDPIDVVNVVAIQRGRTHPDHVVFVMGHYDSRVTDVMDATSFAPGANDDASGTVATLEAARVLSRHAFDNTIVYAALAGEEQGLFGGRILADWTTAQGWRVEGVLNNDIIGNTEGITGIVDNTTVRVMAPGLPPTTDAEQLNRILRMGGELDNPSRQLARYVKRIGDLYFPTLDVLMIYRLDRFGRGGDHTPMFLAGFPSVRLTETHENYTRQHQDVRVENGIRYGDLPEGMDFPYLARVTALNAAALASLAWAPPAPTGVAIAGAVRPSTTLRWQPVAAPDLAGYRVYWRAPTAPTWEHSRWAGDVTELTLENVVIDNHFFGVAAVDREGNESRIVFPMP